MKKNRNNEKKPIRVRLRIQGRPNPQFIIYYSDATSQSFTKRCSPEVAEKLKKEMTDRIALGTFDLKDFTYLRSRSCDLVTACAEYLSYRDRQVQQDKLAKTTLSMDYESLKVFVKNLDPVKNVGEIKKETIENFIIALKSGKNKSNLKYKNTSINSYLKHIRGAFSRFVEKGYTDQNPLETISKLPSSTKKRIVTSEELKAIRKELDKSPTIWKRQVFDLALNTGMRRDEIHRLKKENFKETEVSQIGKFYFLEITGKGNKKRNVPLMGKSLQIIENRLDVLWNPHKIRDIIRSQKSNIGDYSEEYMRRFESGYLFFEVVDPHTISQSMRRVFLRAGISDLRFHDLRKSFGTFVLENGATLETVQAILGHGDKKTTEQFYTEVSLIKIIQEMNNFEGK